MVESAAGKLLDSAHLVAAPYVTEVEQIVNSRKVKGVVQYQVRWSGCIELEDTWQTFEDLDNCLKKLTQF